MGASRAGYVLVGGQSSRFGADKAFALWQGKPLALWVAEIVRSTTRSVTLVGDPAKYGALGLPVIADQVAGVGPLAGLSAVLQHSTADRNLVTACDMPYLRADFLEFLLQAGDADVVLPVDRQGRDEPLCAVYSIECASGVARALEGGIRKLTKALEGLRVRRLAYEEYAQFDPDGLLFANLNTPSELAAMKAHG